MPWDGSARRERGRRKEAYRFGKCPACGRLLKVVAVYRYGDVTADEEIEPHSRIDPDTEEVRHCPGSWRLADYGPWDD